MFDHRAPSIAIPLGDSPRTTMPQSTSLWNSQACGHPSMRHPSHHMMTASTTAPPSRRSSTIPARAAAPACSSFRRSRRVSAYAMVPSLRRRQSASTRHDGAVHQCDPYIPSAAGLCRPRSRTAFSPFLPAISHAISLPNAENQASTPPHLGTQTYWAF
jgi:hypothetical protein